MDTTDHHGISKEPADEPAGGELFNPLTGDLNDLVLTHQHCWLWPQITHEIDRLAGMAEDARTFLALLVSCFLWWLASTTRGGVSLWPS